MSHTMRLLSTLLNRQRLLTPLLAAARQQERPATERESLVRAAWEQFADLPIEERRCAFELCAGSVYGPALVAWLDLGAKGDGLLEAILTACSEMEEGLQTYPGPISDPEEEREAREQAAREEAERLPRPDSGGFWER